MELSRSARLLESKLAQSHGHDELLEHLHIGRRRQVVGACSLERLEHGGGLGEQGGGRKGAGQRAKSAAEKADAILFAGNVRSEMAKEMHVPVTEHSYEDVFFAMHMHKIHKEQVGNTFVIRAMKNTFGLTYDAIKTLMDQFAAATGADDTVMDADEFCRCLDLKPGTREAASLFHFFDNDDSGTVEFSEAGLKRKTEPFLRPRWKNWKPSQLIPSGFGRMWYMPPPRKIGRCLVLYS